jgi:hypothetical protein
VVLKNKKEVVVQKGELNNCCEAQPERVQLPPISAGECSKSYAEAAARKGIEQWTEVRRKKPREKPIYGEKQTKDDEPKLEATTTERLWRLYIGNLKSTTSTQNVETYCARFGVVVNGIEIISNQDADNPDKSVAMKLEVDYTYKDTVMNAKFWPKGVRVRGWYMKKRRNF